MSHVAKIELEIKDLTALESACTSLGLELVRGQSTYRWYGQSEGDYPLPEGFKASDLGKCTHAIRIAGNPQAYEIGVVENKNGKPGYTLLWDFWNGGYGLEAKVGSNGQLLKQHYSSAVARAHMVRQGYRVTETKKQDGTLVLRAMR